MSEIIQVQDNGQICLPAHSHRWQPRTSLHFFENGKKLVLEPVEESDLAARSAEAWANRSPAERASALSGMLRALPPSQQTNIPDEALRRENMYD